MDSGINTICTQLWEELDNKCFFEGPVDKRVICCITMRNCFTVGSNSSLHFSGQTYSTDQPQTFLTPGLPHKHNFTST